MNAGFKQSHDNLQLLQEPALSLPLRQRNTESRKNKNKCLSALKMRCHTLGREWIKCPVQLRQQMLETGLYPLSQSPTALELPYKCLCHRLSGCPRPLKASSQNQTDPLLIVVCCPFGFSFLSSISFIHGGVINAQVCGWLSFNVNDPFHKVAIKGFYFFRTLVCTSCL